jgi:hypothetical protein
MLEASVKAKEMVRMGGHAAQASHVAVINCGADAGTQLESFDCFGVEACKTATKEHLFEIF